MLKDHLGGVATVHFMFLHLVDVLEQCLAINLLATQIRTTLQLTLAGLNAVFLEESKIRAMFGN